MWQFMCLKLEEQITYVDISLTLENSKIQTLFTYICRLVDTSEEKFWNLCRQYLLVLLCYPNDRVSPEKNLFGFTHINVRNKFSTCRSYDPDLIKCKTPTICSNRELFWGGVRRETLAELVGVDKAASELIEWVHLSRVAKIPLYLFTLNVQVVDTQLSFGKLSTNDWLGQQWFIRGSSVYVSQYLITQ